MPGSPQVGRLPPSSFDSATSHANQSFYGLGPEVSPPQALEAGEPEFVDSPEVFSNSEIKDLMHKAIASNEELARAVSELQMSVSNLEIQVSDLQLQLRWYEEEADSSPTQFYDLINSTSESRTSRCNCSLAWYYHATTCY